MLQSYKAVLKGNQLEWMDEKKVSMNNQPVLVYVTLLKEEPISQALKLPGKSAVDILEEIAGLNGAVSKMTDPVKWQREMRQEQTDPFMEVE